MLKRLSILFLFFLYTYHSIAQESGPLKKTFSKTILFDDDWKFSLSANEAAIEPNYNDKQWRVLNLPHDWSIEGSYSKTGGGDWQSGFLPCGIGWYRKAFNYDKSWTGNLVDIKFEGIYLNSEVYINGHFLGKRPNGYVGFTYDLTPYLQKGKNIITVKVDHSKPLSGRWYTGSGIYRHVWLNVKPKMFIDQEESFSTAKINTNNAVINHEIALKNLTGDVQAIKIVSIIKNMAGQTITENNSKLTVSLGEKTIKHTLVIPQPKLWNTQNPYLYKLISQLVIGNKIIHTTTVPLGLRSLEFSGDFGFKINGVNTKIKGVCLHQDAGALGVAVPDEIWLRKLKQLKEMGTNAIRTSHHPFSPTFYNYCDSLGIMVLNEAFDGWERPKAKDDYGNYFEEWWNKDLEAFVKRDRHHPSVIMWSAGNEVFRGLASTQKKIIDLIHQFDPENRPVTQGGVDPTRGMEDTEAMTQLDVKGFNGDGEEIGTYENYHAKFPNIPMIGTEVPHTYQTRGVYKTKTHWRMRDFPAPWEIRSGKAGTLKGLENHIFLIPDLSEDEVFPEEKTTIYHQNDSIFKISNDKPWAKDLYYQSSYDNASVRSSARKAWQRTEEFQFVMGQFRWTGFDYLGETNQWPSRFANFGVIDIAGFPKDHFYLYQSFWTSEPMVHMLPHWTHPGKEGITIPVVVYTNCDSVRLEQDGKSLGTKKYAGEQLVWNVIYKPGKLTAIAFKDGKVVASNENISASDPFKIDVKLNKKSLIANGKDLIICEISITDDKGNFNPHFNQMLTFDVKGPVVIKGTDNGDPLDLSDYQTNKRRAFKGKCLLILETTDKTGKVEINIKGNGLKSERIQLKSKRK